MPVAPLDVVKFTEPPAHRVQLMTPPAVPKSTFVAVLSETSVVPILMAVNCPFANVVTGTSAGPTLFRIAIWSEFTDIAPCPVARKTAVVVLGGPRAAFFLGTDPIYFLTNTLAVVSVPPSRFGRCDSTDRVPSAFNHHFSVVTRSPIGVPTVRVISSLPPSSLAFVEICIVPISALAKFMLVALVAYGINLLTVMVAIHYIGLNDYIAQALGIPPYTLTSFFASKYLVFRAKHQLTE